MSEIDQLREAVQRLALVVRHLVSLGEDWDTDERIRRLNQIDKLLGLEPQNPNWPVPLKVNPMSDPINHEAERA